ncbi:unnamed protein product [Clonostachys byssicola]|uniref:Uncharacterized protein n=1 Tax=Clonostachys byssicola TaxID=160290 RepID=A0A9N9U3P3_9HYPO|nr:unnamed protein product [Clonostachys byssicola]
MVAINNIALPTAVVLGLVSQAMALPVQATQDIVESGLLERAIEAELDTRDLEERFSIGKAFKKVAGVGKSLLGFRDLAELDEREIEELVARYYDDSELDTRDLEERKFSIGKVFKKVAGTAAKILFRDLSERDIDELDERDIDELVTRAFDESSEFQLETRDIDELDERDLEERLFIGKMIRKGLGVAKHILSRDLSERDLESLDERDLEELVARALDEELEERDFDEELEERDFDEELEERDFDDELEERDFDELDERDLEERFSIGKAFKKVAGTAAKILFRDLSERDIDSLDERDVEELVTRAFDESSELETRDFDDMLDERDLEERKFSIGKVFKKVAGTAAKILFRDLGEEELSERDIEDIVARSFEEHDDLE